MSACFKMSQFFLFWPEHPHSAANLADLAGNHITGPIFMSCRQTCLHAVLRLHYYFCASSMTHAFQTPRLQAKDNPICSEFAPAKCECNRKCSVSTQTHFSIDSFVIFLALSWLVSLPCAESILLLLVPSQSISSSFARLEGAPDRPFGSRFRNTRVGAGLLAAALAPRPSEPLLAALLCELPS